MDEEQSHPGDMSMADVTLEPVLDYIHRLPRKGTNRDANDADLLNRFVARQDENAFVGLLQRHARLVWAVCRRVHGNVHDAEDSFQATFFVFARQAGTIRRSGSLASWLYRLAYRTAMHAKKNAYKRRRREEKVAVPAGQVVPATSGLQELQAVLDEEVNRLAEKHRTPFVLCCLQGKSKSEAAAECGWKEGTVSSRLAQARKILQERLTRRGITLSAVLTADAVSERAASAAVPMTLLNSTAQTAFQFASGKTTAIACSASAATLASGVLKAMLWQKVKVVSVLFLAAIFLGTGTSVVSSGAFGSKPVALQTEAKPNADQQPEAGQKKQERVDLYCEPLPQGALARMGTIQFRHPLSKWPDLTEPRIVVAFSPDGQVIATSDKERLRLWNANSGKLLFEIKTSDWFWRGQVFSPDGRFLATPLVHYTPEEGGESYVCIWDAKTGKLRHRFPPRKGPGSDIRHILFSPNSKLLAVACDQGTIHLWNTDTGKEVAVLSPKTAKTGYSCIAFAPDSKTIVTLLHQPRKIWHWDIARGGVSKVVSLETLDAKKEVEEGKTGTYHGYALAEDGRTLACHFFGDPIVHLLDTATGKVRSRLEVEVDARYGRMAFTPDSRFLATAKQTGGDESRMILSLCDTGTGKLKHQIKILSQNPGEFVPDLTFSPDGSRVIIGRWYIRLYDVASGKELLSKPAHQRTVSSLAFTPDGGTLISGGADGMIGIWDVATGKSRHFLPSVRWGSVTGVALVPGGSTFVSGGQDGLIRLQDWRTGKEIRRFGFDADEKQQFTGLRVSGGKTVISQVYTGFHSWDLATGKLLRSFPRQGSTDLPSLTADGKHFISIKRGTRIDDDKSVQPDGSSTVEVREIASGRLLFTRRETDSWGSVSLLTADGRLLIQRIWRKNPTIRLWELATGKERLRIVSREKGEPFYYDHIALSPDGRILATARHDNTLQFWDLFTGKELLRHSGYLESVYTMTFSPNGKFLATGHDNGAILVWDVSLPKRKASPVARSAKELDSWWKALAGEDAARAHTAIGNLVESPEQAVALFKERLRPAADKSERIAKLIAQLDDAKFAARDAATKELRTLGSEAEPALRRALNQKPSLEKRRRIEDILDRPAMLAPEVVQGIRAMEVLEYLATSGADATRRAAIALLKKLAGGAPEARLTQEAKAALRR
jgi:RNA polymerase sigma factor (sigma-70 family)